MTKARKSYPSDVIEEERAFCAPYLTLMKGLEPGGLGAAKVFYVIEGLTPAVQGAYGDGQQVNQFVQLRALDAQVGQVFKVRDQTQSGLRVLHPQFKA